MKENEIEEMNRSTARLSELNEKVMAATAKLYGHPRFYEILEEIKEATSRKAHDYASDKDPLSNIKQVAEVIGTEPYMVTFMFIATKFFRVANLLQRDETLNESIDDSLLDIAVYAILMKILMEGS